MKQNFLIFLDFTKKLLFRDRSVIKTMVVRDLRAQYVGSLFGFLWAIIEPLSQVVIYGIVFGFLLKSKPDPEYGTDSFFLYLITGIIPWQFFAQAFGLSANAIVSNSNLIKKSVGFPSEILPIIKVLTSVVSHFIAMSLLLLIVGIMMGFSPYMPLFLVYMFLIIIFAIGLGWIVSSINVYLRDVQKLVGVIIMAWMFLTPLFYSTHIIPAEALPFFKLNPMFQAVMGYRYALLAGRMLPWQDLLYLAGVSFAVLQECLTHIVPITTPGLAGEAGTHGIPAVVKQ